MLWFSVLLLRRKARSFPFCDGLLAIDGLEYVRPPAGQFY